MRAAAEPCRVRIQILLYLLKLALPGPQPPDAVEEDAPLARRHKRGKPKPKIAVLSVQERLESLMDKMATWQMLDSFGDDSTGRKHNVNSKDERDWTQKFCEDVVEPLSVLHLPLRLLKIYTNLLSFPIDSRRNFQNSVISFARRSSLTRPSRMTTSPTQSVGPARRR